MITFRNLVGMLLTFAYLGLMSWYIFENLPAIKEMEPNALGDMLAGAFGPLAFAWLILGYMQQGDELRQSTQALKLQAEELKASVEQQTVIAEATKQQLLNEIERFKYEKDIAQKNALELAAQREIEHQKRQPALNVFFVFQSASGGIVNGVINVSNYGAPCVITRSEYSIYTGIRTVTSPLRVGAGETKELTRLMYNVKDANRYLDNSEDLEKGFFTIAYRDDSMSASQVKLLVEPSSEGNWRTPIFTKEP